MSEECINYDLTGLVDLQGVLVPLSASLEWGLDLVISLDAITDIRDCLLEGLIDILQDLVSLRLVWVDDIAWYLLFDLFFFCFQYWSRVFLIIIAIILLVDGLYLVRRGPEPDVLTVPVSLSAKAPTEKVRLIRKTMMARRKVFTGERILNSDIKSSLSVWSLREDYISLRSIMNPSCVRSTCELYIFW